MTRILNIFHFTHFRRGRYKTLFNKYLFKQMCVNDPTISSNCSLQSEWFKEVIRNFSPSGYLNKGQNKRRRAITKSSVKPKLI